MFIAAVFLSARRWEPQMSFNRWMVAVPPVAELPRICLPMQETQVWFLSQEDPLEKEMATHCSILAWEIPWTEKPGGLQSTGSEKSQIRLNAHTVEWLNQIMKYDSALKRSELWSHEKIWRELECILLSERSQLEKAVQYVIPTPSYSEKGNAMETVKRIVVARVGVGRGVK